MVERIKRGDSLVHSTHGNITFRNVEMDFEYVTRDGPELTYMSKFTVDDEVKAAVDRVGHEIEVLDELPGYRSLIRTEPLDNFFDNI